jgi:subtilase-type serine protease
LAYDGVIGGNGIVRQLGAGTTTLSGAGSNASTLDVQAGTLELASTASLSATTMSIAVGATLGNDGMLAGTTGNDTFTLAGTFIGSVSLLDGDDQVQIADGAAFSQAAFDGGSGVDTLDLTSNSALTLSQTLATDFESLVKRGNGALTLSGAVDGFSDSITIEAGTAYLDSASIQTSELRIDSGVTVTGTGSLSGSLNNAGLLSPGNSPGTIHIGGNYVQQASGTLISEITRGGTDLLDIAGSAMLGGTHQIQVEYGLFLDGTTHTLIQAAGGITGDFASRQMNLSALMEATRELNANALAISFERQPFTSLTDLSEGRERFAGYLEEQIATGTVDATMSDYIDTLLQQTTSEQVVSLLGERSESVAGVTQNNISMLGAGFARTVFERFTLSDTAQCVATQPGSSDTLNCFWAHGLRQWGNATGDARHAWTTNGGQFGVDRKLSSEFALGATFGYADTGISDQSGGRNDLRSRLGGLYANYASGQLTLGALAFYSGNESETRRSVLVGSTAQQARGEFDGDSYGASARLGYRLTGDAGPLVRPYIEAFYDHVEATGFTETGAGAGNLSARVHGRDGLRGTLGLQLADDFEGYGRVFRPALDVGVAHQFDDVRSTLDLQPFDNAAAFRTYGPALDRTSYLARVSLNVSLGTNASAAFGYGGELSNDYSQHEGNLSFRIAW